MKTMKALWHRAGQLGVTLGALLATHAAMAVNNLLAGKGVGDKGEVEAQHQMLAYECTADGTSKKLATLKMVRK